MTTSSLRPANKDDSRYVLKTSLRAMKKMFPESIFSEYYKRQEQLVFKLIQNPANKVHMITLDDQDIGFVIHTPTLNVTHFLYLKEPHRLKGHANHTIRTLGYKFHSLPTPATRGRSNVEQRYAPHLLAWAITEKV